MTHQVQVSIPYFNSLPEDCATNVWHFNRIGAPTTDPADLQDIVDNLVVFYSTVYNQTGSGAMAPYADPGHTRFKVYDLTDATPRPARLDVEAVVGGDMLTSVTLPPEAAVCCSISGDGTGGVPMASQRGRIYLGVIGDGAIEQGSDAAFPTVSEGFRNFVISAASSLVGDAITAGWTWVVYSRKLGTTYPVVKGFVDDALDTQRRRGQQSTIRTTWPV